MYYSIGRLQGEEFAETVLAEIRRLPIEILPADEAAVFAAARRKLHHRLSHADAFVAAAAEGYGAILVTGDPELLATVTL